MGWGAIIYLAALTNIDPQLYEAAVVDGAGKMRCMWNITLPTIAPTIITMLLLRMGQLFNVGFERASAPDPLTYETSDIISTYVYRRGLQANDFLRYRGGFVQFDYLSDTACGFKHRIQAASAKPGCGREVS